VVVVGIGAVAGDVAALGVVAVIVNPPTDSGAGAGGRG